MNVLFAFDALNLYEINDNQRSAFGVFVSKLLELAFDLLSHKAPVGCLTFEETAEVLGVSAETVKRDWKLAKAWLRRELRGER